jgi:hypothetical protein
VSGYRSIDEYVLSTLELALGDLMIGNLYHAGRWAYMAEHHARRDGASREAIQACEDFDFFARLLDDVRAGREVLS